MASYNDQLYLLNSIRTRVAVITNTALSLTCVIAGVVSEDVTSKSVWWGCGAVSATAGLVSSGKYEDNQRAASDVTVVSDQVRTNELYTRLSQGDPPFDYSRQAYNYIVMELGKGTAREALLNNLDPNPTRAIKVWAELEQRYGKLPTGVV